MALLLLVGTVMLTLPRAGKQLSLRLTFLLCGSLTYMIYLWENRDTRFKWHPYTNGQRVYFILYIVLAWLTILTGVSAASTIAHGRAMRWAAMVTLSLSGASSLLCADDIMSRPDFHFDQQVQKEGLSGSFSFRAKMARTAPKYRRRGQSHVEDFGG